MSSSDVAEEEDGLVDGASMRDLVSREPRQTHLRNELVDKDDHTNGADEASQEGSAKNVVQEAESEEARYQNEGASKTRHNASDLSIPSTIIIPSCALLDVLTHDFAHQQRTWRFGSDNHLWAGAEDCVDQGVQGEAVKAVYRWHVCEVGGIR